MNLDVFQYIEEAGKILESKNGKLLEIEKALTTFFVDSFSAKDHFINVRSRIKEISSLKEKILRHNLYNLYDTPEKLLDNLSDLIGVRIECRFIADEKNIYKEIRNLFRIKGENGFRTSFINDNINLSFEEIQPMRQKNGFEIYKIDGKYVDETGSYNFELQIKSLVNVFWGDIDHKILYKNFNYMLSENFLVDIMGSIKENLEMIDRELMILYNHLNEGGTNHAENTKKEILHILSKNLHDLYAIKLRKDIGFPIDFKTSCDTIINYIFMKLGYDDNNFVTEFTRIMNRIRFLETKYIDFRTYIEYPTEMYYNDRFTQAIGNRLNELINTDFSWNLFFRMLFDLEEGSKEEIINNLLVFLSNRYKEAVNVALSNRDLSDKDRSIIHDFIMTKLSENFSKESPVEFVTERHINGIIKIIQKSFSEIFDGWDLKEIKDKISENMKLGG